jgi:hypothetical protein
MKTKTWKVMTNTGKEAQLECGVDVKVVRKPAHIRDREFVHWLAVGSRIDDVSLLSLFKR